MIDINKLLEKIKHTDVFEEYVEDNSPSPCYQMKVDDGKFIFLVDSKEVASTPTYEHSLKDVDVKPLFSKCVELMKQKNFRGLKKLVRSAQNEINSR